MTERPTSLVALSEQQLANAELGIVMDTDTSVEVWSEVLSLASILQADEKERQIDHILTNVSHEGLGVRAEIPVTSDATACWDAANSHRLSGGDPVMVVQAALDAARAEERAHYDSLLEHHEAEAADYEEKLRSARDEERERCVQAVNSALSFHSYAGEFAVNAIRALGDTPEGESDG
jgi:hypothetical protein